MPRKNGKTNHMKRDIRKFKENKKSEQEKAREKHKSLKYGDGESKCMWHRI